MTIITKYNFTLVD